MPALVVDFVASVVVAEADFAVPVLAAASGLAIADFDIESVVLVVVVLAAVAGLAAAVVVVEVDLAAVLTDFLAASDEQLTNLPDASWQRCEALLVVVVVVLGHLVNLPDASRHDAASAWPAVNRSAAAVAASSVEERRMERLP